MVSPATIEALIFAAGRSQVWGDDDRMPTALSPVCGKPLLGHCIDELREVGIRRIAIATDCPAQVEARLPKLSTYQMQVRILDPDRETRFECGHVLLCSAERLSEPVLHHLLHDEAGTLALCRDGRALGALMRGGVSASPLGLRERTLAEPMTRLRTTARSLEVGTENALLDANLAVLRGSFAVTRISGLEAAPNVRLEWWPSVRPASVSGPVHIGDGASVHMTAELRDAVVGRHAVILPHARLDRCLVLDGATVPSGMKLTRAIVTPNLILFPEEAPCAEAAALAPTERRECERWT